MAYQSWSVVFGEQPSAAKWNILGSNDASFNDGTGIADGAVTPAKRAGGFKVGFFSPSATGSLAITGVGFTPKFIRFTVITVGSSTVNYGGDGATDGTTQFATAWYNEQGVDNSGRVSATSCLSAILANAVVAVEASFTSFDADGFTLDVTTRAASRTIYYEAYA